ncbi:MAG: hypothetical protein P1V97_14890 [Planctomycetota bacterium]|nr:hypothetical protein [Planctomycetota bacterium]
MLRVQARSTTSIQCPYCHSNLRDEACETCSRCQTQSHRDCLGIHGACPVFGCHAKQKIIIDFAQRTRELDEEAAHRLFYSRWTLAALGFIFCFVAMNATPAFKKMFDEIEPNLSLFSRTVTTLFGTWNGWSSVLVTVLLLALNRSLGRCFPGLQEHLNNLFSLLFLIFLPCLLIYALFSPLLTPVHYYVK